MGGGGIRLLAHQHVPPVELSTDTCAYEGTSPRNLVSQLLRTGCNPTPSSARGYL